MWSDMYTWAPKMLKLSIYNVLWMKYQIAIPADNRICACGCGEMINENSYNAITSSSLKVIIILNKILSEIL